MKILRPNRRTGKFVNCYTCLKEIYIPKCKLKMYDRHYCSKECMNISPYKKEVTSKRMKNNNPSFNPIIREKINKSVERYWKTHKPYNFIDGSSRNRKYNKRKWINLAKKCYKRDNFTCQNCNKKGGQLNAHHILPWAGNKELAFDINNLITLCVSCHAKVHNRRFKK